MATECGDVDEMVLDSILLAAKVHAGTVADMNIDEKVVFFHTRYGQLIVHGREGERKRAASGYNSLAQWLPRLQIISRFEAQSLVTPATSSCSLELPPGLDLKEDGGNNS